MHTVGTYSSDCSSIQRHFLREVKVISIPSRSIHYENTPMQYTVIFHGLKNANFPMKNCDIILIVAQNIDFGYTFEPPHRGGSKEYPQSMF